MLLHEMEIFYNVVLLHSFSKAAERLGVSKSYVSKHITKLENELSVKLVLRSTRKLSLTEAGNNFFKCCEKVVEEASQGYAIISELKGTPSGRLKISAPPAVGMYILSKVIPEFISSYPNVKLDIELNIELVDIIKGGYDLVFRSAKLEASNLIALPLSPIKNIICATPRYFKKFGVPKKPNDLEEHNFVAYGLEKKETKLEFMRGDKQQDVFVQGNFTCNNMDFMKNMALHDVCVSVFADYVVNAEIKSGLLVTCLDSYKIKDSDFYVIYPERKFKLPKLQCFLELLRKFEYL